MANMGQPADKAVTRRCILLGFAQRETQMTYLKIGGDVVGALCLLLGVVWICQGVNVMPGSFMTGDVGRSSGGDVLAVMALLALFLPLRKPGAKRS